MRTIEKSLPRLLLVGLLGIGGCVTGNGYEKFYTPVGPARMAVPVAQQPQLFRGGANTDEDLATAMENGFRIVGYSSFNGPAEDVAHAREFGRRIGAELVLVYGKYTNTREGSIPLILPSAPTTSTTTTSGSIYGAGGSGTYTGTATTTASGGYTTQHIPYRVDRFDQSAAYFVKAKKAILGIYYRDLNADERARLQRNRGVVVTVVRKGTPAFRADILRGDCLLEVGGQPVDDSQGCDRLLQAHAGQKVTIKYVRGIETREMEIQLDPAS